MRQWDDGKFMIVKIDWIISPVKICCLNWTPVMIFNFLLFLTKVIQVESKPYWAELKLLRCVGRMLSYIVIITTNYRVLAAVNIYVTQNSCRLWTYCHHKILNSRMKKISSIASPSGVLTNKNVLWQWAK